MLLLRLWNYIRGYVIILIEGYFLEKFINICTHRQIFLWDIRRHKNCVMTLKVSIQGFKMLRPVARKTNCRVRIVKKKGLPFLSNRYRRRKVFVAGAVFFIALIYILSSFVWVVEVAGNKNIETAAILEMLAGHGIKPGVMKYRVNPDNVVNAMMVEIEELAWVSVVVKGTKIKVQVVERRKPPEMVPTEIPCNIVAKRDGVIKTVLAKEGLEQVKEGDTVTAGQLLISGSIPIKNEPEKSRLVHAMGEVIARTWYEEESHVETKTQERVRTGKSKDNYSLLLLNARLGLFPSGADYEVYDKIEIKKQISIGQDLVLPFGIIIDRYYEVVVQEKETELDTAKQAAADSAYEKLKSVIPETAEVKKTDINFVQAEDGSLTAKVTIECLEDIGATEKIGGN